MFARHPCSSSLLPQAAQSFLDDGLPELDLIIRVAPQYATQGGECRRMKYQGEM
jgi:hypothetical protein